MAILVAGCGGQARRAQPSQTPVAAVQSPSPAPSPSPQAQPSTAPAHVFVIVMENRSYAQALTGGYTAQLAHRYAYATSYSAVAHPSLPNYLALTSGSTWGVTDDGFHRLPAGGLGAQLTSSRIPWRAYMEGMTNGCFDSPYPYALKHNPFAYYGATCDSHILPFTQMSRDLAGTAPRFAWITPDMCHDGHDCTTAAADAWLARTVPLILASGAWKQNGVLFITWDEGYDAANSVLTVVIRPRQLNHVSKRAYNHYSLLATIEDALGVPRLGAAARATPMSDLMAVS